MSNRLLDVTGLRCPMPVLKTRKALAIMAPGERLEVLATDPGSPDDMIDLCRLMSCLLVESEVQSEGAPADGKTYRFVIEVGGGT